MVVVIQINMGSDTPWTEVIETSLMVENSEDDAEDRSDLSKWIQEINRLNDDETGEVDGSWDVLERARVKDRPVTVEKFMEIWN